MKFIRRASALFFFTLALAASPLLSADALAQSSYFTSRGCVNCHTAPTTATCAGCHQHSGTLSAVTNKTTAYAPGETVTVTMTASGARTGWIGARLYNQSGLEIARSAGNQSGMGGSTLYPAVLSAPAPAAAGTYTWKVAYFGNNNGTGTGDVHSEKSVNVTFSVASAADTTAPTVSAFTLPATATSLTVPVSSLTASDNTAVTGYLVNTSATKPLASAAGWSAAAPTSVTAPAAGNVTFYAWAKDAAGNVSASRSASVDITLTVADTVAPTLTISALANGSYTNKVTLNISGNASDAGGLKSLSVNGAPIAVGVDGSFSTALTLQGGGNTVTVIATDNAGNQKTDVRTITYDPDAPVLTIANPADNSNTVQTFVTISGAVSEAATVKVAVNNGSPQPTVISDTSFTATVYLVPGLNTIDVTATDLAGNVASAKRSITCDNVNSFALAVTYPSQDITTSRSELILKGKISDALSRVTVRISVDGKTYTPRVQDGEFRQKLIFRTAKQYAIIVTAMDEADNSSTVTRNVIYRPAQKDSDDGHERDDD